MALTISLLTALFSFTIALFVYLKNTRSSTHILFSALIFFIGLYPIFNYLSLNSSDAETAFFWAKFVLLSAIPAGPLFYLFVRVFPSSKFDINKILSWLILLWVVLNIFLSLFGYVFLSVSIVEGAPVIVPGAAVGSFGLLQVLSIIAGSRVLVLKYRRASGLLRRQLQYITFGIITSFGLTAIATLILPLILGVSIFIPISPLFLLIAGITIAYSIVRHRLLDIRLVVARTVSYTLLVGAFGLFYALLFSLFSSLFFSTITEIRTIFVSTILAFIMAFTFQPLRRLLESATDKIFYKGKYDTNILLYNLALIMASTLRLEEVTHGILDELLMQMKVNKGAFILTENDKIFDIKSKGYKNPPSFSEDEVKTLLGTRNTLVFDELDEGEIKETLRQQELSVTLHLRTGGEQAGILILGSKESGDIYSEQDIKVLEILAPEVAVAIQNAKAYEEIRRFNITLQEEVDRATADLKTANIKLQELDKLKDEFVSLASHELRSPMTVIKGSLSTILDGYAGETSKEAKEFLTAAYSENDRLIRLVNNLLNISRIESGRLKFLVTNVDMSKLMKDVVTNLQMATKEKSLTLTIGETGTLPLVLGDEDKVREVLINLIGNAIKFTHQGGITVSAKVENDTLITSVADTGNGIAQEDQDLLFKKFSQVSRGTYSHQTGGTGLGLYISKKIIEGLHGQIWLTSTVGKGTTFYFSLPVVK